MKGNFGMPVALFTVGGGEPPRVDWIFPGRTNPSLRKGELVPWVSARRARKQLRKLRALEEKLRRAQTAARERRRADLNELRARVPTVPRAKPKRAPEPNRPQPPFAVPPKLKFRLPRREYQPSYETPLPDRDAPPCYAVPAHVALSAEEWRAVEAWNDDWGDDELDRLLGSRRKRQRLLDAPSHAV